VRAFVNAFYADAFFLKVLGLNGVCTTACPTGPKYPDPKVLLTSLHPLHSQKRRSHSPQPYGVNYAGGTFKFTVTLSSGSKRIAAGRSLCTVESYVWQFHMQRQ
jgi:integrin alpha FG-GAP repeat containing protein 1